MKLVVPLMMPASHWIRLAGQPFAQRLDDGDAAGHGRLERHHHAAGLGRREDLRAVHGQQRLVGRDHVLAGRNRFEHQLAGQVVAADQFDDDLDLGVADDVARIGHHTGGIAHDGAGLFLSLIHI